MKKVNLIFAGVFFLLLSIGTNAQTKTGIDYFKGKWNVVVIGAPDGDMKMVVGIELIDNNVTGSIKDSTGKELYKVTSIEINDKQVTINFTGSQDFDVPLVLGKKDDDHVTGNIMGMFVVEGERIKEK